MRSTLTAVQKGILQQRIRRASPTDEEVPAVEGDSTSTPAEEKVSEDPQTEDNIVVEEATQNEEPVEVPKILEQVPNGTDLVVLNEDGGSETLASQAAAEILVEGDPIWCPTGVAPDPTNPNCTSSHTGFDDLIAELSVSSFSGDGVIWVESSYNANDDSANISFDSTTLTSLGSLSVQGGWDGIAGSRSVDPNNPSILDDRMEFIYWTGDVSISNLYFNNP